MVLKPIPEPATFELSFGANPLAGQAALVCRSELALVVLKTGAQPIKGITGVKDEQGVGIIPVEFAEISAAFD